MESFYLWSLTAATLLAALFASTPLVALVTGSLFVENVWALFLTAGIIAAISDYGLATAILLGSACATKVGSWLPALAVLLLLSVRYSFRAKWWMYFIGMAAPPYLSAWIQTGNPFFPFANAFFRSPFFETTRSFVETRFQEPLSWDILLRLTTESHLFFEGKDGALGFQYLLFLPITLLILRSWRRQEVLCAAALFAMLLGIASSQRNLRYLYAVLPAATMMIGRTWQVFFTSSRVFSTIAIAVIGANALYLANADYYHRDFAPWPWDDPAVAKYKEAHAPVRTIVNYLNQNHPGEGVIFIASGQSAGLHARSYINSWHQYPFHKRALSCQDAGEWKHLAQELNARWVIGLAGRAHTDAEDAFLATHTHAQLTIGDLRLFRIE